MISITDYLTARLLGFNHAQTLTEKACSVTEPYIMIFLMLLKCRSKDKVYKIRFQYNSCSLQSQGGEENREEISQEAVENPGFNMIVSCHFIHYI